jgi:F-type H+-transporting ATPase subunit a
MLSFTCVIFFGTTLGVIGGEAMNLFSIVMLLFMYALEVLVAFVQAYVFTLLSSVFIGLAHVEEHAE